jgi:hypothetical protein
MPSTEVLTIVPMYWPHNRIVRYRQLSEVAGITDARSLPSRARTHVGAATNITARHLRHANQTATKQPRETISRLCLLSHIVWRTREQ